MISNIYSTFSHNLHVGIYMDSLFVGMVGSTPT